MARKLQTDVYFSADIESDGPIPGVHSMLSLGFAVCGSYDGERFEPIDPELHTFYRELRPAFDEFEPTALAAIGMDREQLAQDGADPAAAMTEAAAWVQKIAREISGAAKPVFVAYPLGFDWMFVYWYLVRFSETGSPFGFSSFLDMKTLYAARAGATVGASTKAQMPRHLLSNRKHTHNALDDAIEQGEMFQNLFVWDGRQR
jgi:hypothetical protein